MPDHVLHRRLHKNRNLTKLYSFDMAKNLWPYASIIDVTCVNYIFTLIKGVFHKIVI